MTEKHSARSVRGAASIAGDLARARDARRIGPGERIHILGAAGAGASAAALLAHEAGAFVSGCDPGGPSPYTPPLEAVGVPLEWRHDPDHVTGSARPERLGVTKALTAIDPDNPELAAARRLGIPLEPWQQIVADAAFGRTLVGVAGTHGKSTTSGWLVHVLVEAGLDPCAFVGALMPATLCVGGLASTARWGSGQPFVVEADEYAGNFDAYRPAISVVTSLEWDHPDVFADIEAVVACFEAWLRAAAANGSSGQAARLIANVADPGVADLVARLDDWPGTTTLVRLVPEGGGLASGVANRESDREVLIGRIVAADPDGTTLELSGSRFATTETAHLRLAGRHNASNALCVAGAAVALGVAPQIVAAALGSFVGVGRRLERKGEGRGVVVYDDYGHHPTAIRETLAAVRQREPGRRVWAVYEPLTYHRTAAMLDEFAAVLATADGVAIADIWAGRDPDTTITSAAALARAVGRLRPEMTVAAPGSVDETAVWLDHHVRAGDAVLVMGGGKSYRIAEELVAALQGDDTGE